MKNSYLIRLFSASSVYIILIFLFCTLTFAGDEQTEGSHKINIAKINISKQMELVSDFIENKAYYKAIGRLSLFIKAGEGMPKEEFYNILVKAADAYMNINRHTMSMQYLEQAVKLKKTPIEAYILLQKAAFFKNEFNDSVSHYKKLDTMTKTNRLPVENNYMAMSSYYILKKYAKAIDAADLIIKGKVSDFTPYARYIKAMSGIWLNRKDKKKRLSFINILKKAASNKRYSQDIINKIRLGAAMALFEEGEYKRALDAYSSVDGKKYISDALYGMIWCNIKLRAFDKALLLIDSIISDYPESEHFEDIMMLKGQVLAKTGKYEDAISAFEAAKKEFEFAINLMNRSMMHKNYIYRISSLFEVAQFPPFRYSKDFRHLRLKSVKAKRSTEKRLLKQLAKNKDLYLALLRVITIRNIIDSLDRTKMAYGSISNRYEYNITHFRDMIGVFKKEIDNLKNINISNIKTKIGKDSSLVNIDTFATPSEKLLINRVRQELFNSDKLLSYLSSIKSVFKNASRKDFFFKELQKIMLSSPEFSSSNTLSSDNNIRLNDYEQMFLDEAESDDKRIVQLHTELNTVLWAASEVMMADSERKAEYWKEEHNSIEKRIFQFFDVATDLQGKIFARKAKLRDFIRKRIGKRKKELNKKIYVIEKKIDELEIISAQLIVHIDSMLKEMKPIEDMMKMAGHSIQYLKRRSRNELISVKDFFKNRLVEKIKKKIGEYTLLMDEADYEIADNLFRITAGGG